MEEKSVLASCSCDRVVCNLFLNRRLASTAAGAACRGVWPRPADFGLWWSGATGPETRYRIPRAQRQHAPQGALLRLKSSKLRGLIPA